MNPLAALGALALLQSAPVTADRSDSAPPAPRVVAARGTPEIDGRLDEMVWQAGDSATGFTQIEPVFGAPSAYRTVARLARDAGNLYVGIRAFDPDAGGIVAPLIRRDLVAPSDWLYVAFDSHRDRRSAYVFAVNPAGVKRDFLSANGKEDDPSWDAVWDVAVTRDSAGWTAEFRIPLAALRYRHGAPDWGLQFLRIVARSQETSAWAPMRPDDPGKIGRFGELAQLEDLPRRRNAELLPYVVASMHRRPRPEALHATSTSAAKDFGLDAKYGLGPQLTLDLTLNPDFGQVEADPAQVNLTATELSLPERRPFFREGADVLRFSLAFDPSSPEQLFYSRRIGSAPRLRHLAPPPADVAQRTTIPIAAKLAGRLPGGLSVGALGARTSRAAARWHDTSGAPQGVVVDPATTYGVLRVRRDHNAGRSHLGSVATFVRRELDPSTSAWLGSTAAVGGMDASHLWGRNEWYAAATLLGSRFEGTPAAVNRLQRSPVRYFQRPDADHVSVDSAATSLGGWSASYQLGKIAGLWRGGVAGTIRSPGFEVNDAGFQSQADVVEYVLWSARRSYTPSGPFRNHGLNFNNWVAHDFGGRRLYGGSYLGAFGLLQNLWQVSAGITVRPSGSDPRALRGGPGLRTPPTALVHVGAETPRHYPLRGSITITGEGDAETGGRGYAISPGLRWSTTPATIISVSPTYSHLHSTAQYVGTFADAHSVPRFAVGVIDQTTLGAQIRVEHTFAPDLSLQVFAQPFISAGRYSGFRQVANASAADPARRFADLAATRGNGVIGVDLDGDGASDASFPDPNYSSRQLDVNAVLRWEYRTGSAILVAWTHDRRAADGAGTFSLREDLRRLGRAAADDVLMVKASFWLAR